ncbi:hypothetical protein E2I00_003890, partial [Balaenoptera physalus]
RPAPMTQTRRAVTCVIPARRRGSRQRQNMAELGRVAVRDPDSLLPGGFWAAVAVWVERPQVANKRLCGARLEARRSGGPGPRPSAGPEQGPQESQGRRQQGEDQREAAKAPLLSGAPGQPDKAGAGEGDFPASDLDSLWDDFSRSLASGNREMLAFFTRSWAESQLEAQHELDVILRTVIPKTNTHCPLSAPRREIVVQERWHSDGIVYPKPTWLGEELLAKLARWCVGSRQSGFKSTLSLISIMKYSKAYQALKEKYKDMVKESAITPNDKTLFPDVDWLIGNHSDELTPWIPVIAARSSYNCRFFIVPCCFFDFIGKYQRRQSKKTQYRGYLDFITEVGSTCGFHVEEDCLRIPSTKRVCLIGKSRTYPPAGEDSVDERRTRYINSRPGGPGRGALDAGAGHTPESSAEGLWLSGFHPREKVKRVRNCAALPRDFIDRVVLQVANLLLGGKQLNMRSSQSRSAKAWNRGGSLSLAEVAGELDRDTLRRLRRERGGLRTLLRNSSQVFHVLNGRVRLRDWREERPRKEKEPEAKRRLFSETFKTRICWFFAHHPDGCVLPSDRCPFAHGPGELQPATTRKKKQPLPGAGTPSMRETPSSAERCASDLVAFKVLTGDVITPHRS